MSVDSESRDVGKGIKRTKGVHIRPAAKVCEQCSRTFEKPPKSTYKEWEPRRFCSNACSAKSRPPAQVIALHCVWCGNAFTVEPYDLVKQYPARYCKHSCASAARDTGYTTEEKRVRRSTEYKRWRTAVFERDNYTCQLCGKRGGELNADHIKPFAHFPELRFDVDNGRTLCVPCHRATDTYGFKAWRH